MKSLRSTGRSTAARAAVRWSGCPGNAARRSAPRGRPRRRPDRRAPAQADRMVPDQAARWRCLLDLSDRAKTTLRARLFQRGAETARRVVARGDLGRAELPRRGFALACATAARVSEQMRANTSGTGDVRRSAIGPSVRAALSRRSVSSGERGTGTDRAAASADALAEIARAAATISAAAEFSSTVSRYGPVRTLKQCPERRSVQRGIATADRLDRRARQVRRPPG